jgi:hypothetical protein
VVKGLVMQEGCAIPPKSEVTDTVTNQFGVKSRWTMDALRKLADGTVIDHPKYGRGVIKRSESSPLCWWDKPNPLPHHSFSNGESDPWNVPFTVLSVTEALEKLKLEVLRENSVICPTVSVPAPEVKKDVPVEERWKAPTEDESIHTPIRGQAKLDKDADDLRQKRIADTIAACKAASECLDTPSSKPKWVSNELSPLMVPARKKFPAGKKRYVCVNRLAITENLRNKDNRFPTVVVVEDGVKYEFHAAHFGGLLKFDPADTGPAPCYMVTEDEIECFVDPGAPSAFIPTPRNQVNWSNLKLLYQKPMALLSVLWNGFLSAPVVSCFSGRS